MSLAISLTLFILCRFAFNRSYLGNGIYNQCCPYKTKNYHIHSCETFMIHKIPINRLMVGDIYLVIVGIDMGSLLSPL